MTYTEIITLLFTFMGALYLIGIFQFIILLVLKKKYRSKEDGRI